MVNKGFSGFRVVTRFKCCGNLTDENPAFPY